jgi:hypothetical protein
MTLTDVLLFATVLAAGISTGGMWLFLMGILPIREQMVAPSFVQFHQLSSPLIDRWVPTGVGLSFVLALVTAISGDVGSVTTVALVCGAVLSVAVFGLSLALNVPINKTVNGWSLQSVPAEWTRLFDRWRNAHVVRTTCEVVAFCAFTLAAVAA